jgi:hypothetical protein
MGLSGGELEASVMGLSGGEQEASMMGLSGGEQEGVPRHARGTRLAVT